MPLKLDLIAINRMYAGEANVVLPYTLEDVRQILITNTKFNKTYTFKGILHPDTVNKLRTEGLDVILDEDNHTIVSWQIR